MVRLGPSIFWLPMLIGWTEGPVPVKTGVVVLGGITEVFLSRGIFPLASYQFTTGGYFRTPTSLRVAPVTIYLWRTARTPCKSLSLVATPPTLVWLNGKMTTRMIAGISRFVNNLCGELPLGSVSISDFSFLSVTSVSSYQLISFWIAFGDIFV